MATQSKNGRAKTAKPKAQSKPAAKKAANTTKATAERPGRARTAAETAVDVPVGAVLEVTDRVSGLVEPLTDRSVATKQLETYKTRLQRTVKQTERRGTDARLKATTEARRTRTRVEREALKGRRTVEDRVRRNRDDVEHLVRRAIDEQASRAQSFVSQVSSQLAALR